MTNPELLGQIEQFAASGQGSESTKKILISSGWKKTEVEEAIIELGGEEFFSKQQKAATAVLRPRVIDVQIKKSRWKLRLLAAVGVAAILAGAVYGFYLYPRSKSLEVILSSTINNLIGARSFRYDTKGKIDFNIPNVSSSLKFLGLDLGRIFEEKRSSSTLVFDAGGYSSFSSDGQLKVSVEVNAKVSSDKLSEILASGEVLLIGETAYFKLTRAGGGVGFLENTPVMGQWVKGDSIPIDANMIPLSADRRRIFNKLLKDNQFLSVKEKLADENVEGIQAYHFSLSIDQNFFQEFFASWLDSVLLVSSDAANEGLSTQEKVDGWKKKFQEVEFSGDIEMWVGKDKNVPLRTLVSLKIKNKKGVWNIDLDWDTLYSKFNEPSPGLEEPLNVKSKAEWEKDFSRVLDDRRVLNLKGTRVLVDNYYKKCGFYPGPGNCAGGFGAAPENWGALLEVLKKSGFEDKRINIDLDSDSVYQYGSDGGRYIMGVALSSTLNPVFRGGVLRGVAFGVNCNYAVFCLSSFDRN